MNFILSALLLGFPRTVISSKTSRLIVPQDNVRYSHISWQGDGPGPWKVLSKLNFEHASTDGIRIHTLQFDARSPSAMKGEWFPYVDGGIGVGVSPGTQVGWRLTHGPASAVVFYMDHTPLVEGRYSGSQSNRPHGVLHFGTTGAAILNESLPEASPNANYSMVEKPEEDIWTNTTGASLVPWKISVSAENGCYDGRTLLLSMIDSAGGVFPIRVPVSVADSPHDVTWFTYPRPTALTFKLGAVPNSIPQFHPPPWRVTFIGVTRIRAAQAGGIIT
ncbi:hypothetical protein C8J57DRAFT_1235452 [Mycena rebaudengoi]|nr:hypothetical protein C8J57DRAFT_1235452 [Mycena rebaudengoi]